MRKTVEIKNGWVDIEIENDNNGMVIVGGEMFIDNNNDNVAEERKPLTAEESEKFFNNKKVDQKIGRKWSTQDEGYNTGFFV